MTHDASSENVSILLPGDDLDAVRRRLRKRVVEPPALADLLESSSPCLYGDVEGEAMWIGVHLPGRQRSRQSLFHGRLRQRGDRWHLVGEFKASLSDRVNEVLLITVAVASLGLGAAGALAIGPAILVTTVLLALVAGLRRGARGSRARDRALLRDLLTAEGDR